MVAGAGILPGGKRRRRHRQRLAGGAEAGEGARLPGALGESAVVERCLEALVFGGVQEAGEAELLQRLRGPSQQVRPGRSLAACPRARVAPRGAGGNAGGAGRREGLPALGLAAGAGGVCQASHVASGLHPAALVLVPPFLSPPFRWRCSSSCPGCSNTFATGRLRFLIVAPVLGGAGRDLQRSPSPAPA